MKTIRFAAELFGWYVAFLWLMGTVGAGDFMLTYVWHR
jgi:hypothetical protein